jgi:hypothetical protein
LKSIFNFFFKGNQRFPPPKPKVPPGGLFKGHPDVGKAIIDVLEKDTRMKELYACGHNRILKKLRN